MTSRRRLSRDPSSCSRLSMGTGPSRQLEASQAVVGRLTSELKRVNAQLQTTQFHLRQAEQDASKLPVLVNELRGAKTELQAAPKAHEVSELRKQLERKKRESVEQQGQLQALHGELEKSRMELEKTFGKLKLSEAEGMAMRARSEEEEEEKRRRLLAARHSAQLVTHANAKLQAVSMLSSNESSTHLPHPIYGELLLDYGYKQLYRGSPLTLWTGTLVWESQRAFRQERARLIASAKARSGVQGWPGSITVVEQEESQQETGEGEEGGQEPGVLIDGQHRLGAAFLLEQAGKLSEPLQSILVEVYPPMPDKAVKELFTEINKAEPVTFVDLPESGITRSENVILSEVAEKLKARYPEMFKASHNCRPPHLNVDVLRNELHKAEILRRHRLDSSDALLAWIDAQNTKRRSLSDDWITDETAHGPKSVSAREKALKKARKEDFFLGLSLEWLYSKD